MLNLIFVVVKGHFLHSSIWSFPLFSLDNFCWSCYVCFTQLRLLLLASICKFYGTFWTEWQKVAFLELVFSTAITYNILLILFLPIDFKSNVSPNQDIFIIFQTFSVKKQFLMCIKKKFVALVEYWKRHVESRL